MACIILTCFAAWRLCNPIRRQGLWLDPKAADPRTEREVLVLEGGKKAVSSAKMKYKAR